MVTKSKLKSWKVGVALAVCLLGVLVVVFFPRDRRPDRFLVPQGYVGWLIIEHGVKGAPATSIVNGRNLYQFSSTGRIKTSTSLDHRWGSDDYYYMTPHGLKHIPDSSQPGQDTGIGVMIWDQKSGYGGADGFPETEGAFVGTISQHDNAERGPEPRSEAEETRDKALAAQDKADQVREKAQNKLR